MPSEAEGTRAPVATPFGAPTSAGRLVPRQLTAPADLATLAPLQHVAVDAVGRHDVFVPDLHGRVSPVGGRGEERGDAGAPQRVRGDLVADGGESGLGALPPREPARLGLDLPRGIGALVPGARRRPRRCRRRLAASDWWGRGALVAPPLSSGGSTPSIAARAISWRNATPSPRLSSIPEATHRSTAGSSSGANTSSSHISAWGCTIATASSSERAGASNRDARASTASHTVREVAQHHPKRMNRRPTRSPPPPDHPSARRYRPADPARVESTAHRTPRKAPEHCRADRRTPPQAPSSRCPTHRSPAPAALPPNRPRREAPPTATQARPHARAKARSRPEERPRSLLWRACRARCASSRILPPTSGSVLRPRSWRSAEMIAA